MTDKGPQWASRRHHLPLLFISPHQKARRLAPQMSLRSLRKLDRGPGIDDGYYSRLNPARNRPSTSSVAASRRVGASNRWLRSRPPPAAPQGPRIRPATLSACRSSALPPPALAPAQNKPRV